jgi:sugar phosphate isomerase/epimerase
MTNGLVSNCWQHQLSAGVKLDELLTEAVRRKFQVIELRQGSLGEYESGASSLPDDTRLAELSERFPEMSFNIAMSVPFLRSLSSADTMLLNAGRRAALAVAGAGRPHLRLVDLVSPFDVNYELAHRNLVALAQSMESINGMLSIEHSFQEWHGLLHAFRSARTALGERKARLRFCFDPCNLQMADEEIDVAAAARTLSSDEISMVHIKQCRDGSVLPDVSTGGVNWQSVGNALKDVGYCGPSLFELASSADIWGQLENSRRHLEESGVIPSVDS